MTAEPDPRTDADDNEDATNEGRSAQAPAEGGDDIVPRQPGSPRDEGSDIGEAELGAGTTGG